MLDSRQLIGIVVILIVYVSKAKPNYQCWQNLQVSPVLDSGMYPVFFEGTGSYGYPTFLIPRYPHEVSIAYTDCYCPGDYFAILDNGKVLLDSQTNSIPSCTPSTSNCATYQNNPATCLTTVTYCRNSATSYYVSANKVHNITVLTLNSPFNRGIMWIGFYNNTGGTRRCNPNCFFGKSPNVDSIYPSCDPEDSLSSSSDCKNNCNKLY